MLLRRSLGLLGLHQMLQRLLIKFNKFFFCLVRCDR
jgi:hypothetical protein